MESGKTNANFELNLVTHVLRTGEFKEVLDLGIESRHFLTDDGKQLFKYIFEFFHARDTQRQVPTLEIAKATFPSVYFREGDPDRFDVRALCAMVREGSLRKELRNLGAELMALSKAKDPSVAVDLLTERMPTLTWQKRGDRSLLLADSLQAVMDDYDTVKYADGLLGLPYPWDIMNAETQGQQGGEFNLIYGRPKSGKTWRGLDICTNTYLEADARVLIVTREMPPKQLTRRCMSLIAGVPYNQLRTGRLDPEGEALCREIASDLKSTEQYLYERSGRRKALLITSDLEDGVGGNQGIRTLAKDFGADMIYVDGVYLMKDSRTKQRTIDWKAISHITQDLKETAQLLNIPILGSSQANRGGEHEWGNDMTDLAHGDGFAQDCDMAMRIVLSMQPDPDRPGFKKSTHVCVLSGGREFRLDAFELDFNPCTSMGFLRIMSEDDLRKVKEARIASSEQIKADAKKRARENADGDGGERKTAHRPSNHPMGSVSQFSASKKKASSG